MGDVACALARGRKPLEVDRRMVRSASLPFAASRGRFPAREKRSAPPRYSSGVFKIAEAGYTNAGKSSR